MSAYKAELIRAYRSAIRDIEYLIRLKTDDIERLSERKAELERKIREYEGMSKI